jgi:hypothetical protein
MFTPSLIHSVELYNSRSVGARDLFEGRLPAKCQRQPHSWVLRGKAPQGEDKREHAGEPLLRRQEQQRVHKHMHGLTEILQSREHFHTVAPET